MTDVEWHSGLFIYVGNKFTILINSQQVPESVLFQTSCANIYIFACYNKESCLVILDIWKPPFLENSDVSVKEEFLEIQILRFQFNFSRILSCSAGLDNETVFPLSLQFFFFLALNDFIIGFE